MAIPREGRTRNCNGFTQSGQYNVSGAVFTALFQYRFHGAFSNAARRASIFCRNFRTP